MTPQCRFLIASSIVMALGLTACGGGSGGGVATIPPPPSAPPPPPPPPPPPAGPASIGAPAAAAAPNASLFPTATAGGPTMQSHPETLFPLLETVVTIDSGGLTADKVTINGGATLRQSSALDDYQIDIGNPEIGISDQPLGLDWCGYCAGVGDRHVWVRIADPATSNLNWTTYGTWGVHVDFGVPSSTAAAFVTGYKTPAGSVPTTGTATYVGSVVGQVMHAEAGQENGVGIADLTGKASLQANFGDDSISGSLTDMMAGSLPWNSVSLSGTISGGQFSGATAATSAPGNALAMAASATGTFNGMFFGPKAQELGAVWTLYDGHFAAIGSIGATTASGGSPWDY